MDSLTETFCLIDDFCGQFEPAWHKRLLQGGLKKRRRRSGLSLSELMTLAVLFHPLRYRQFKSFYPTTTPAATCAPSSPGCRAASAPPD